MDDPLVVSISVGKLKGYEAKDYYGNKYYNFKGIPYAKPPLGTLRFRDPQPIEPWTDIRDATKHGNQCYNRDLMVKVQTGSEDCLFLNVYTPKLPVHSPGVKLPVMFWIHPGGYKSGSGNSEIYGPGFLIGEGIVLVTINYRIGVLGFMSFDDPALKIPGNAGMKDIVMALKWVQQNIDRFGGDPDNVTIFGGSAGAMSVHFLMLSPMSKGLFHKAICQSGLACGSIYGTNTTPKQLAEVLGYHSENERDILEFLNKIPVNKLIDAGEKCLDFNYTRLGESPYYPIIENPSSTEPAFLTRNPIELIESGNFYCVPLLIGHCAHEGMMILGKWYNSTLAVDHCFKNPEYLVHPNWNLSKGSEISKRIGEMIQQFYYGETTPSDTNWQPLTDFTTDLVFTMPNIRTLKKHLKHHPQNKAPIYYYSFSVDAGLNLYKRIFGITVPGTCHGDEIGYLFTTAETPPRIPFYTVEMRTVRIMTKLWTNFAKCGNPNPTSKDPLINVDWQPINERDFHYLDVCNKGVKVGVNPEHKRYVFWEKIYQMLKEKRNGNI